MISLAIGSSELLGKKTSSLELADLYRTAITSRRSEVYPVRKGSPKHLSAREVDRESSPESPEESLNSGGGIKAKINNFAGPSTERALLRTRSRR